MKKYIFLASFISLILLCSISAWAAEKKTAGTGQTGTTLSLAYDGSYLYYKEVVDGQRFNRDYGWMSGAFLELRGDNQYMFVRMTANYTRSTTATYDGALTDGTPYKASTIEQTYLGELNMGYKALNFGRMTVSPYAGIGYRDWLRGEDDLPSYEEDYSWWYVSAGLNLVYKYQRWALGLDGAVLFPFAMEMTTNVAGLYDNARFKLKSRPGYRAEATLSYDAYKKEGLTVSVFGTPYYQRWNIGASSIVYLTQGGTPVRAAYEPKSNTDVYGVRLGMGVNF